MSARGGGGNWNRAGRRSGGARPVSIPVGTRIELPLVSMPCFERRHGECSGDLTMAPGECECDCHERNRPPNQKEKP